MRHLMSPLDLTVEELDELLQGRNWLHCSLNQAQELVLVMKLPC